VVSERRYRDLLESTSDLVYFLDLEGRVLAVNPRVEERCGFRAAKLRGTHLAELAVEEHAAELRRLVAACPQGGSHPGALEIDLLRSRRRILPVELTARATIVARRPVGLLVVAHDMSERLRLAEELRRGRRVDAVVRGLVHDLGNQLTVGTNYLELVRSRLEPDHPARADLEQIFGATEGAASLARQILDVGGRIRGLGMGASAALHALSSDLERSGARVRVSSEPSGTRWEIYLPVGDARA
jgi:PAS domain S-box-containing protein